MPIIALEFRTNLALRTTHSRHLLGNHVLCDCASLTPILSPPASGGFAKQLHKPMHPNEKQPACTNPQDPQARHDNQSSNSTDRGDVLVTDQELCGTETPALVTATLWARCAGTRREEFGPGAAQRTVLPSTTSSVFLLGLLMQAVMATRHEDARRPKPGSVASTSR